MSRDMLVDPRSAELAEYFTEDQDVTEAQTTDLAQTIQTCIEDWFSNLESDREAARQNAADKAAGMKSFDADVQLIRLPKVKEKVGLGTSQIYAMMSRSEFPRPVRLGVKAVAWNRAEVDEFIADRLAERDAAAKSARAAISKATGGDL